MRNSFLAAYKVLRNANVPLVDTVYPLSNYLMADFVLNENRKFKLLEEDLGIAGFKSVDELLDNQIGTLQKDKNTFETYYQCNALAKLYLCQCLFDTVGSATLHENFKSNLLNSINDYANMKHIMGEAEHLEFIIEFVKDEKLKTFLRDIQDKLLNMLKN